MCQALLPAYWIQLNPHNRIIIIPILQRRKLRLRKVFTATRNVMEQPDFEPRQPGSPAALIHCMYDLLFSVRCSVPLFVIIMPPYWVSANVWAIRWHSLPESHNSPGRWRSLLTCTLQMGTQSREGTYLKEMSGIWIVDGMGSYSLALWFWRTKCSLLLTRCSPNGSDRVWGHGLLNQPSRAWLGLTSVQTKAGRSQGLGRCQAYLTPWGGHTELVIHGSGEPEICFSACQTFAPKSLRIRTQHRPGQLSDLRWRHGMGWLCGFLRSGESPAVFFWSHIDFLTWVSMTAWRRGQPGWSTSQSGPGMVRRPEGHETSHPLPTSTSWRACPAQLIVLFYKIPFITNWAYLVAQRQRIRLQCRRPGFGPWVRKIPWRRAWQPTPVFLPGESHGQRSLAGYSPWGHKGLDTTEVT